MWSSRISVSIKLRQGGSLFLVFIELFDVVGSPYDHGDLAVPLLFYVAFYGFLHLVYWVV
jgi:hypothetical protein